MWTTLSAPSLAAIRPSRDCSLITSTVPVSFVLKKIVLRLLEEGLHVKYLRSFLMALEKTLFLASLLTWPMRRGCNDF